MSMYANKHHSLCQVVLSIRLGIIRTWSECYVWSYSHNFLFRVISLLLLFQLFI